MTDQTTRNDDNDERDSFRGIVGATDALEEKLADAMTPGFAAEFSPLEAERAGAFIEDAMSIADAMDSAFDGEPSNDVTAEAQRAGNVIVGTFPTRNIAGQREV
jgi:hypothetical protein